MKIRPEKYEDVDDEVWERVEVFREVVRERTRAERSLSERAKELLGIETRFSAAAEIVEEVFEGVTAPPEIERHLEQANEYIDAGDDRQAQEYLVDEFGSDCDSVPPEFHEVGNAGRVSYCHRHRGSEEDPQKLLDRTLLHSD